MDRGSQGTVLRFDSEPGWLRRGQDQTTDSITSISPLAPIELEAMGGYRYSDPRIRGQGEGLPFVPLLYPDPEEPV